MMNAFNALKDKNILWVGCGHAPEALLWLINGAASGAALRVYAIERSSQAVNRAHQLIRLLYMAYYGTVAEDAANLNLNEEVVFGNSRITVVHQDIFDYTKCTMPPDHDYDLVYSAAGYDAMDDHGMRLSLMLIGNSVSNRNWFIDDVQVNVGQTRTYHATC